MNKSLLTGCLLLLLVPYESTAQTPEDGINDSLRFSGQLSAYLHLNPDNTLPLWSGTRYLPQLNYEIDLSKLRLIDFETSANIYGNAGLDPFDSLGSNGDIKPYRIWARYSSKQFELRAGLQKINFGSASILRPLMWFDQIDPRDPLRITDGVWGILGRYYFLNNANVWIWALYGNKNPKGWEILRTNENYPELGGRIQVPVPRGEAGLAFHHRIADSRNLSGLDYEFSKISENRIGFDAKFDLIVGLWLEGSWVHTTKDLGEFTNQEIFNLGVDYTFGLGNGLTVIYEQLLAAYDDKAFAFGQVTTFSLLSARYPVGLFDNLSVIVYYDWENKSAYNFINWQKQFNKVSLYLMGYINPRNYNIPTQGSTDILYAGSGIQLMMVFNH